MILSSNFISTLVMYPKQARVLLVFALSLLPYSLFRRVLLLLLELSIDRFIKWNMFTIGSEWVSESSEKGNESREMSKAYISS